MEERLESWKEIGAYLQRDARTARRWETEEGLPVHRQSHKARSSVYAFRSELDAWRVSRKVVAEPEPPVGVWKSFLAPRRSLTFGVTLALCLVMVGNGFRPQTASAQGTAPAARLAWADGDAWGSISADGRYMSFTDWSTGDLAIRDMRTGINRRLTTTEPGKAGGYAQGSAISADGGQVAYLWHSRAGDELRIRSVSGETPHIPAATKNDAYAQPFGWTPDGKQVALARQIADRSSQIAMLAVQDGSVRVIKSFGWQNMRASLSPDGRHVAYDAPAGPNTQSRDIFVLATDGSTEAAVVKHPANDYSPVWSGDGSRVLFLSERTGSRALWSVAIEKGQAKGAPEPIKAAAGARLLGATRDGALYYSVPNDKANIYFAELGADGKAKAPVLASESFVNHNFGPNVSGDGRFLAFAAHPWTDRGLVIRTLATGEERVIPRLSIDTGAFPWGPKWFPDGRSMLLMGKESQKALNAFYRLDLATGKVALLHRKTKGGVGGWALSPDGTTMYYVDGTGEGGGKRILRVDLETQRETELLRGNVRTLAVSPDNRELAYTGFEGNDSYSIHAMPANGGASRELYRSKSSHVTPRNILAWSPDQRFLVFAKDENGGGSSLWRVPAAGGEAEQLLAAVKGMIRNAQVHPDGSRLAFDTLERATDIWTLENFLPVAAK